MIVVAAISVRVKVDKLIMINSIPASGEKRISRGLTCLNYFNIGKPSIDDNDSNRDRQINWRAGARTSLLLAPV